MFLHLLVYCTLCLCLLLNTFENLTLGTKTMRGSPQEQMDRVKSNGADGDNVNELNWII